MGCRSAASVLLFTALLGGEVTDPKSQATGYPVHAVAGRVSVGAEYMVRSYQGRNQTFVTNDYLVVLVAVYPPKFEKIPVSLDQFTLRLNGKKIHAQMTSFVAASVKYPEWGRDRRITAVGGLGDVGMILGPTPAPRFPGDPTPTRDRLPRPPRVPDDGRPGDLDPPEPVQPEEIIVTYALPEGEHSVPVAGYVYFPYRKKTKSIRSLELVYDGPDGSATLRLQ